MRWPYHQSKKPILLWQRTRTESIGATGRESPYLDSRDVGDEAMVFDERPLTDVEDPDTEPEMRTSYHFPPRDTPHPPVSAAFDSVPRRSASSGEHVSSMSTTSRIPAPSLNWQFTDPPRSRTPTGPPRVSRGSSEPVPPSPSPSSIQPQSNKTRARRRLQQEQQRAHKRLGRKQEVLPRTCLPLPSQMGARRQRRIHLVL